MGISFRIDFTQSTNAVVYAADLCLGTRASATELRGEHAKGLTIVLRVLKDGLDATEVGPLTVLAEDADQVTELGSPTRDEGSSCLRHGDTFSVARARKPTLKVPPYFPLVFPTRPESILHKPWKFSHFHPSSRQWALG